MNKDNPINMCIRQSTEHRTPNVNRRPQFILHHCIADRRSRLISGKGSRQVDRTIYKYKWNE